MSKAFLVSSFLASFKRHWWVAAATLSSTLVGAVAYLMVTPPEYETSLRIMLDEQQVSISDLGQSLTELNSNVAIGVDPFATQSEIITSKRLVERALQSLSNDIASERRDFSEDDVDDVADRISVRVVPATNILQLSLLYPDPEEAANILNTIAQSAIEQNVEDIRRGASSVRQFLENKIPEQQIRLELAEAAEREYRQTYGIVSLNRQTEGLISSLTSIDAEMRSLTAQLQESAEREALLKQVTNSQSLQSAYTTARVGQNETLRDLQNRLTGIEAGVIEAQSRLGDQHPDLLALREQRDELRNLYGQELTRVSGGSSTLEAYPTSEQISNDLVSRYIVGQIERQALEQRLAAIQTQKVNLQDQAQQLANRQQPLAALVRQREEAAITLQNLQGKLEEARIAEAQLISNIRIISTAEVPDSPAEPSAPVILFLGIVVGSLLAGGAVFVLDFFDASIRTEEEVEALLDLPVLGFLPELPLEQAGMSRWEQFIEDPELIEPYRRLLKKIERLQQVNTASDTSKARSRQKGDHRLGNHTVVLTSILEGEGKSAITAHLGIVAALLSRRALIIDGDQYRPVQDLYFDVPSYPGLSEVVSGGKDLTDAVRPTAVERLELLPQGQMSNRPSVMAESLAMQTFLDETPTPYNWVLIDSATVSQSADASTYSSYADGIVLVVRPEFTQKQSLQSMVEELKESGATILGVVLSKAVLPEEEEEFALTRRRTAVRPNRFVLGGNRN